MVIKTGAARAGTQGVMALRCHFAWPSGAALPEPLFIDASDGPRHLSLGQLVAATGAPAADGGSLELAGTAAVSATGLFQDLSSRTERPDHCPAQ